MRDDADRVHPPGGASVGVGHPDFDAELDAAFTPLEHYLHAGTTTLEPREQAWLLRARTSRIGRKK